MTDRPQSFLRRSPPDLQVNHGREQAIPPKGKKSLLAGLILAIVLMAVPLLGFIFGYLGTLVHELGHTVAYWVHGYPAIPAFDFMHGGGLTFHPGRSLMLQLTTFVVFGWLIYLYRTNRQTQCILIALTIGHGIFGFTSLHLMLTSGAGHLMELLIAGIFLYRAIKGSAITHAIERPLYAGLGFFLVFRSARLCTRLMTSAEFQMDYAEGKGGYIRSDLIILAEDFFGTGVEVPAFLLLVLSLATPVLAYLFYRKEPSIAILLDRLLRR